MSTENSSVSLQPSFPTSPHRQTAPHQTAHIISTTIPSLNSSSSSSSSSWNKETENSNNSSSAAPNKVVDFLRSIDLEKYADFFIREGFDRMSSLMDISEDDLTALGVKRGHRRVLQRELMAIYGYSSNLTLPSTSFINGEGDIDIEGIPDKFGNLNDRKRKEMTSSHNDKLIDSPKQNQNGDENNPSQHKFAIKDTITEGCGTKKSTKRKYRRHPKQDLHAPIRPLSAYVMFSNRVRDELKDLNLTFSELARIVGDRWKAVPTVEKNELERQAAEEKEEFLIAWTQYKKTETYREYQKYLIEFKANEVATTNNSNGERSRKQNKNSRNPSVKSPTSFTLPNSIFNSISDTSLTEHIHLYPYSNHGHTQLQNMSSQIVSSKTPKSLSLPPPLLPPPSLPSHSLSTQSSSPTSSLPSLPLLIYTHSPLTPTTATKHTSYTSSSSLSLPPSTNTSQQQTPSWHYTRPVQPLPDTDSTKSFLPPLPPYVATHDPLHGSCSREANSNLIYGSSYGGYRR